jgi:hypothetical protein
MSVLKWLLGGDVEPYPRMRVAEGRWEQHNAEAAAGPCLCGQPWTTVSSYDGAEPVKFYSCGDCAGSIGLRRTSGGVQPVFAHPAPCPLGETCGSVSEVGVAEPYEYHCPHREH